MTALVIHLPLGNPFTVCAHNVAGKSAMWFLIAGCLGLSKHIHKYNYTPILPNTRNVLVIHYDINMTKASLQIVTDIWSLTIHKDVA